MTTENQGTRRPRKPKPPGDYEVGFGKPPVHGRFKKGEPSANPKGRPRGTTGATGLAKVMAKRHRVRLRGKTISLTTDEIILNQIAQQAMAGDLPSARAIFALQLAYDKIKGGNGRTAEDIEQEELRRQATAKANEALIKGLEEQGAFVEVLLAGGLGERAPDGSFKLGRFAGHLSGIHPGNRSYPLGAPKTLQAIWNALDNHFGQGNWD
jgi:hypothetical protein